MSNTFYEPIHKLEKDIGITEGFFEKLLKEEDSDWSFLLKIHSLLDASLTELLNCYFADERLEKIFSSMNLRGSHGKLRFLKELQLLGDDELKYIEELTVLRNSLAHDVRQTNIRLENWVLWQSSADLKPKIKKLTYGYSNQSAILEGPEEEFVKRVTLQIRNILWISAWGFLMFVEEKKKSANKVQTGEEKKRI